jgi:predicted DCC family thiol-disulfide oxidoreductase YuxK
MKNGWTGGQYSVFRAVLAIYLFVHFVSLIPWGPELFSSTGALVPAAASPLAHLFPNVLALYDSPWFVRALLVLGALATVPLAAGICDRSAAILCWYLWACLLGRNPMISNPSIPFVGWMLLAHALMPPAPYGSLAARNRGDPRGTWTMPNTIFLAAWIVLSLGYAYGGATKLVSPSWADGTALGRVLANPLARPGPLRELLLTLPPICLRLLTWSTLGLELLFAPLALVRRIRPWIWLAMVGMHLGLLVLVDFADLTFGMLLVHFFTFDPAWIRARTAQATETVFYDGHCALCHGAVRFALAEDRSNEAFRFAPLQGELFKERIPEGRRAGLPDSLVVLTADGSLLTRSAAVLHVLARMGGLWRVAAGIVRIVPASIRDAAYKAVARIRYRVFGTRVDACPLIPASARLRFDLR